MDPNRLRGKNILITGGARGMGAAIGEHYAGQGANVCLGDIDAAQAKEVAARINAAGNGMAISLSLDVTKRADNAAAVAATVAAFGSLNVVLLNAGIASNPVKFLDITEEHWDRILNVNAKGMFLGMQEAARQFIKQGKENGPYKIINVGSINSRRVFLDLVPYATSKHAVLALVTGGAQALVEHNITVNGYGPGIIRTPMLDNLNDEMVAAGAYEKAEHALSDITRMIPMKRYAYPSDVVGLASFLASAESDYMTGQLIMIDGGIIMQ